MCNQITLAEHCIRPRQISEGREAYVTAALLGGIPPGQSLLCSEAWTCAELQPPGEPGVAWGEPLPQAPWQTDQRRTVGLSSQNGQSGVVKIAKWGARTPSEGSRWQGSTQP